MVTLAEPSDQLQLLDTPPRFRIENNAHARNAYGQAAQEIVCAALKLRSIPINGQRTICFDAKSSYGCYYEIKSVHRSGKVVIYDWRMKKEASAGVPLNYAILCHNAKGIRDGEAVFNTMNQRGLEVFVVPAAIVHELAMKEPMRQIVMCEIANCAGKRQGYSRIGYRDGYRNVPVKLLREHSRPVVRPVEFWLHDVLFQVQIRIYSHYKQELSSIICSLVASR